MRNSKEGQLPGSFKLPGSCPALCIVVFLLVTACSKNLDSDTPRPSADVNFTVEEAPEWTALFKRSQGWFGGDGIFAIPFSGNDYAQSTTKDSIMFVFSDTMVGQITDGRLQPGYKMINNSVMMLNGEEPVEANADFRVNVDESGAPRTLFIPKSPEAQEGDYLWLGDGFVNQAANKNLYLFAYRIRNTNTNDDD